MRMRMKMRLRLRLMKKEEMKNETEKHGGSVVQKMGKSST